MVLEATVVILDNSEWMRNGDYAPSRLEVQLDAAHLICNAKRQANVENAVSIMTMGGSAPKVLVTLTADQSKLQHAVATTRVEGQARCNFASALQVAQLVLKHRQNNNQRQRIIAFVGSPLDLNMPADLEALSGVGKMLRKNGVSVDLVSFGHAEQNMQVITAFLAAVGGLDAAQAQRNIHEALLDPNCDCHLLVVPTGEQISESLMTSPILLGSDGAVGAGDFGMDADMDPELALALKLSLEEEQARLANKEKDATDKGKDNDEDKKGQHNLEIPPPSNEKDMMEGIEEDEEAMMARAIALSMESASKERTTSGKGEDQTKQQ